MIPVVFVLGAVFGILLGWFVWRPDRLEKQIETLRHILWTGEEGKNG